MTVPLCYLIMFHHLSSWEFLEITGEEATIDNHNLIIEATRPQGGASRQGWFDRLTMTNQVTYLILR